MFLIAKILQSCPQKGQIDVGQKSKTSVYFTFKYGLFNSRGGILKPLWAMMQGQRKPCMALGKSCNPAHGPLEKSQAAQCKGQCHEIFEL